MSETTSPPRRRRLLFAAGGLVALLLVAALVVSMLIDVERFRPQIEAALSDATGWDAELGEIDFSLFRVHLRFVEPAQTRPRRDRQHREREEMRGVDRDPREFGGMR